MVASLMINCANPDCGQPFRPKRKGQKYHAPKCGNSVSGKLRYKRHREMICAYVPRERKCAQCGIAFVARIEHQEYHSPSCRKTASGIRYRKRYPEKIQARALASYYRDPKAAMARHGEWMARNPEKARAIDKARYYRDKEKRYAAARKWVDRNPERVAANELARQNRDRSSREAARVLQMFAAGAELAKFLTKRKGEPIQCN